MSAEQLALAASPEVQKQIAALGGAVPDLTTAAGQAMVEHLKSVMDGAKADAVTVLQGFTALTGNLVSDGNRLAREVAKNGKDQAEAKRCNDFFQATGNIFPMRKLIGLPTPKAILEQYPAIDEIPKDWTAPVAAAPAASA